MFKAIVIYSGAIPCKTEKYFSDRGVPGFRYAQPPRRSAPAVAASRPSIPGRTSFSLKEASSTSKIICFTLKQLQSFQNHRFLGRQNGNPELSGSLKDNPEHSGAKRRFRFRGLR